MFFKYSAKPIQYCINGWSEKGKSEDMHCAKIKFLLCPITNMCLLFSCTSYFSVLNASF